MEQRIPVQRNPMQVPRAMPFQRYPTRPPIYPGNPRQNHPGPTPQEPKNRKKKIIVWSISMAVLILVVIISIMLFQKFYQKVIPEEEIIKGVTFSLEEGKPIAYSLYETEYLIQLGSIERGLVEILVLERESENVEFRVNIRVGEIKKIDTTGDDNYDLKFKLNRIRSEVLEIYLQIIDEPICYPNWACEDWSRCVIRTQTRNCTDLNSCETNESKPELNRDCLQNCDEDWVCEEWEECVNGTQKRNCTDNKECGREDKKPAIEQECEEELATSEEPFEEL